MPPALSAAAPRRHPVITESITMRRLLGAAALSFVGLFLLVPLVAVFAHALAKGPGRYLAEILSPQSLSAVKLTLLVAGITVPLNAVFGLAAAWLLARFDFRGKSALLALVDLPFSVSPVI